MKFDKLYSQTITEKSNLLEKLVTAKLKKLGYVPFKKSTHSPWDPDGKVEYGCSLTYAKEVPANLRLELYLFADDSDSDTAGTLALTVVDTRMDITGDSIDEVDVPLKDLVKWVKKSEKELVE